MAVDKPAWSATYWWDPRLTAENSTDIPPEDTSTVPSTVVERSSVMSAARNFLGDVYWQSGPNAGDTKKIWRLEVTGGCISFTGQWANRAAFAKGYLCRFYELVTHLQTLIRLNASC
jgi:hypothetical protein